MVVPQRLADAPTLVMALAGDLFKLRYKGVQSFRRTPSLSVKGHGAILA